MLNVLRMHQAEAAKIDEDLVPPELLSAAQESWDEAVELAEQYGVRNAQASVLAPTGCLVGGHLVADRPGLVRLASSGDPEGAKWQDLAMAVATDDGPRPATQFFVNGLSQWSRWRRHGVTGSRARRRTGSRWSTPGPASGCGAASPTCGPATWCPCAMGRLVGTPQHVPLPPLGDAYWTGEHRLDVPRTMTAALAELVGYFMGDGSLHSRGLRFCVTAGDVDVAERLVLSVKECFGAEAKRPLPSGATPRCGIDSVRLALWWEACGFAKRRPPRATPARATGPHARRPAARQRPPRSTGVHPRPVRRPTGTRRPATRPSRTPRSRWSETSSRCCWPWASRRH